MTIQAEALMTALTGAGRAGQEIALLDVREEGVFGRRHILTAVNLPLSRLELRIRDLVPRRGTPLVLCDGGEGLAERALAVVQEAGYRSCSVLAGGIESWAAAGFMLYSGVDVPSKVFGEVVEQRFDTPSITAEALKAKIESGEDLIILDSRPLEEFRDMSIPGAIDTPGAELVYRARDLAPSPETLVVVNCAGRTRSIIGCQSLINAGLPNPVVALRNGTMGWHLAGFTLDSGSERRFGPASASALDWSRAAARQVATRFGVEFIDHGTLDRWRDESGSRTLYVLDVRQAGEYEAGHLPGARPAPGGQLVQSTDQYVAVRGARIVLVDDTLVRATMTASWLRQASYPNVFVLEEGSPAAGLVRGPHRPEILGAHDRSADTITAAALHDAGDQVVTIDLADSLAYRAGHIPGARWAIRARLEEALGRLPPSARYVLTSPDGALAGLAARDLSRLTPVRVSLLEGGTAAWKAAGLALRDGMEHPLTAAEDLYERPYDLEEDIEQAMRAYLAWEMALVAQFERDASLHFPHFPA
jgi:rhodanese-related sulfurtransferase